VILALSGLAAQGDAPRTSGSVSVDYEVPWRQPHASHCCVRLNVWGQLAMCDDAGLYDNLVQQLLRWMNVILEGRVEPQDKLAIPFGRGVRQCSDISCSEHSLRRADKQLSRHATNAKEYPL
jgi:hypothetical protein